MTEHERAEEKPQEPEEGFFVMFERGGIGAVLGDATGRILRVNPKMCEITGYSEEELLGKRTEDLTYPDDRERGLEAFQRMAAGGTPAYGREKRYVRKDSQIRWGSLNATSIRDEAGRLLRIASVLLDITERKRAEERLERQVHQTAIRAEVSAALAGGGTLPDILQWTHGFKAQKATILAFFNPSLDGPWIHSHFMREMYYSFFGVRDGLASPEDECLWEMHGHHISRYSYIPGFYDVPILHHREPFRDLEFVRRWADARNCYLYVDTSVLRNLLVSFTADCNDIDPSRLAPRLAALGAGRIANTISKVGAIWITESTESRAQLFLR